MQRDLNHFTAALFTGLYPLSGKRAFLEFIGDCFPSYVFPFPSLGNVSLTFSQMMRQGANSAVRFTTYATLKQFVQGTIRSGQPLPSAITFGIGGIAGLVTVYTTMPLEYVFLNADCSENLNSQPPFSVIKTRMQSLEARKQYRNSFHCAYRIFTEEGILRFWTGTTPRLTRLVVRSTVFSELLRVVLNFYRFQLSGGIVFTVYEKIIKIISGREV